MGGCIGRGGNEAGINPGDSVSSGSMPMGRNQPLRPEKPKWKSDVPLTDGQLRSKRDEFWDTAPAFEGRKEIWDALKAAALALETGDHSLAQAIIDGANITCPNGTLNDCYDELGNRYVLPVYCLSPPINMVEDHSEADGNADAEILGVPGVESTIKLRLSTGKDIKMVVRSSESIAQVKKRVHAQEEVEPSRQRWFFSGRLLNDKTKIEDIKIPKGYIVQVIVAPENPTPVDN